ncbi:Uncharacterized protein BM_BM10993 [Brugia malayi]|uniref:Bm10993 n=2 Tax=Brugia malayi TaxID=6279 RepID=A0A0K0IQ85_BRUMA|nr:Uncharacterized protein BM_BM10993 [Brugia malayi]CDQ00892.1 Bm10993 [Brugia malayi]VIO86630.1 Uncharacterized protein BM_BM10993 [Brugia malayi]
MAEVRSGFQKLVENECTPRRRRGPGSIRGRLKEEGVLTAVLLLPCPYFLIFPPTTTAATITTPSPRISHPCIISHFTHALHENESQTEIGRDPTIRVTVPLFGETPFFPPYLPLCLNPSPPIPSPPRPLSSTMNEGCWGTTHLFTTPMLI